MGKVTALPKAANDPSTGSGQAPADETLPPFDISVSANFADLQQVMIRMPVTEAITRAEASRRMDIVVDLAQRQVSRQEIRVNEAALKDKRKALDLQQKRRVEQEAQHVAALAEIEAEIVRITMKREQLDVDGAAEWTRMNRAGDYRAQGARKNRLDRLQQDIEAQRAKVGTLTAEYEQKVAKAQDDIIERLTEEIAAIERVIEKHREIVG